MFDVLTYEKGASVLWMIEQYVGADRFRAGVRRYLQAHSYANTETTDLWDAIDAEAGEVPDPGDHGLVDLPGRLPPRERHAGARPRGGRGGRAGPAALRLPAPGGRAGRLGDRLRLADPGPRRSRPTPRPRRERRAGPGAARRRAGRHRL